MATKNTKAVKGIAIGAVLAAAAGYVAGLLTAPKSGKETRSDIKHAAAESKVEAEKQLKKLHTQLTAMLGDAKNQAENVKGQARKELDGAMKKGQVAREKARELLTALHEGDADDEDLKKAITGAQGALTHLKTYIKKA
jgi:gas vesicle protein